MKPQDYPILYKKLCTLAAHRIANSTEYRISQAQCEINLLNRKQALITGEAIAHPEIIDIPTAHARYLASFHPEFKGIEAQVKQQQEIIAKLRGVIPSPLTPDQKAAGKAEVDRMLGKGQINPELLSRQEQFHLWRFLPDAPEEWSYLDDGYNTTVEPILGRILLAGVEIGITTRNSYGVACLNSYGVMFVDIDLDDAAEDVSWDSLPWARTLKEKASIQEVVVAIEEVADDHDLLFQCYKTKRGLRLLELSRVWDATGIESQAILERLGCDRLYQQLCIQQQCYRARMEPKPWRHGDTVCEDLGAIGHETGKSCQAAVIREFHQSCVGAGELA